MRKGTFFTISGILLIVFLFVKYSYYHESCIPGTYTRYRLGTGETLTVNENHSYTHSLGKKHHSGIWLILNIDRQSDVLVFEDWVIFDSPFKEDLGKRTNVSTSIYCKTLSFCDLGDYDFNEVE